MPKKRLGLFGQGLWLAFGASIGSFAFLLFSCFFFGKPIRDAINSAQGYLAGSSKAVQLTDAQSAIVVELLRNGSLISSNDLLTNITAYYSTMIQTLIGLFFVFGVLSFFVVQAQSRRQVEEVAEELVASAAKHHFDSATFDRHVRTSVDSAVSIELEAIDERIGRLEVVSDKVDELDKRVGEIALKPVQEKKEEEE